MFGRNILLSFFTLGLAWSAAGFGGGGLFGGSFGSKGESSGGLTGGIGGNAGSGGGIGGGAGGGLGVGLGGGSGGSSGGGSFGGSFGSKGESSGGLTGGFGGNAGSGGGLGGSSGGGLFGGGSSSGARGGFDGNAGSGGLSGGGLFGGIGGSKGESSGGLTGGLGGNAGSGGSSGGSIFGGLKFGGLFGGDGSGIGGFNIGGLSPCFTPDSCKTVMGEALKLQYQTALTPILSQILLALENTATSLRDSLPDDIIFYMDRAKLTAIAVGARELRTILENPSEITDLKLGNIIERIKEYFAEIMLCGKQDSNKSELQSFQTQITGAFETLARLVVEIWATFSPIVKLIDTSQLSGFNEIDAEVQKTKSISTTGGENNVQPDYIDLMTRIFGFFGIDKSLIYTPNLSPDAGMRIMSNGFKAQYQTLLAVFLSKNLQAIENAATQIRDMLPDNAVFVTERAKLSAIIIAARESRGIIENPKEITDANLADVIKKCQQWWVEITGLSSDKSIVQSYQDGVMNAWQQLTQLVVQAWSQVTAIINLVDTSKISGFGSIDADVKNANNQANYNDIMARILQFFGIDSSLVYQF